MKICEGIYLEVLGAGCRLNRGLVLEDGAQRPPSYFSLPRLHSRTVASAPRPPDIRNK